MFLSPLRRGWYRALPVVTLLTAASFAQAQQAQQAPRQAQSTPVRAERADPLDAQVRVPAATHSSALAGYRRLGEDKRVDWKSANENVNRIGGWRTYAREAQQPEPVTTPPASGNPPATAPAAGTTPAHGGHKKH